MEKIKNSTSNQITNNLKNNNKKLIMQNMKNTQSNIMPIKTKKECRVAYCLGCKEFTNNFRPQELKMTNKVLREKSNCVVCQSNKSRFLKQKHNNKKIQRFTD